MISQVENFTPNIVWWVTVQRPSEIGQKNKMGAELGKNCVGGIYKILLIFICLLGSQPQDISLYVYKYPQN